ncbi:MAG: hypothetical protein GEV04_25240 [Actinophytocola sp.]|nr:hypothetical protein [Actinophytocola sp.]
MGRIETHIIAIEITNATATVDDCLDYSRTRWKDARTGRSIAGSEGPAATWAVTTLRQTPAGWRITKAKARRKACTND